MVKNGRKQIPRYARNDNKKSKNNSKGKDNGKGLVQHVRLCRYWNWLGNFCCLKNHGTVESGSCYVMGTEQRPGKSSYFDIAHYRVLYIRK